MRKCIHRNRESPWQYTLWCVLVKGNHEQSFRNLKYILIHMQIQTQFELEQVD